MTAGSLSGALDIGRLPPISVLVTTLRETTSLTTQPLTAPTISKLTVTSYPNLMMNQSFTFSRASTVRLPPAWDPEN